MAQIDQKVSSEQLYRTRREKSGDAGKSSMAMAEIALKGAVAVAGKAPQKGLAVVGKARQERQKRLWQKEGLAMAEKEGFGQKGCHNR